MNRQTQPSGAILFTAALAALLPFAGCGGGKTYVTRHPQWEYEQYQRVAVVPAKPSDPRAQEQAKLLADRLTTLLADTQTFHVLSRSEMQAVFAEQDLSNMADAIEEGTALPAGKIEIAQALIVPKITVYNLLADRSEQKVPIYRLGPDGFPLRDRAGRVLPPIGEESHFVYRSGAELEGSVRVVDAATGRILFSHSTAVKSRIRTAHDRPPKESPEQLAGEAIAELALDFAKQVAPTRMKVDLKSSMLILARDFFDGKYDEIKKVSRAAQDFLLVVRDLPPTADRNDFRVAIAEENGRENLFEQEFTWSASSGKQGVSFPVPVEKLAAAGGTKFVAKLYSAGDPEPKLQRTFALEQAKE
jgi:hypothetical protein